MGEEAEVSAPISLPPSLPHLGDGLLVDGHPAHKVRVQQDRRRGLERAEDAEDFARGRDGGLHLARVARHARGRPHGRVLDQGGQLVLAVRLGQEAVEGLCAWVDGWRMEKGGGEVELGHRWRLHVRTHALSSRAPSHALPLALARQSRTHTHTHTPSDGRPTSPWRRGEGRVLLAEFGKKNRGGSRLSGAKDEWGGERAPSPSLLSHSLVPPSRPSHTHGRNPALPTPSLRAWTPSPPGPGLSDAHRCLPLRTRRL